MNIRLASIDDAQEISEIITGNFNGKHYTHLPDDERQVYLTANTPKRIEKKIEQDNARMYVADDGNSIKGVIFFFFDENKGDNGGWRIKRMHTHPDYAGNGLADKLLDQAYFHAIRDGHDKIYAHPTPEVESFFRKRGWEGYIVMRKAGTEFSTIMNRMEAYKSLKDHWMFS